MLNRLVIRTACLLLAATSLFAAGSVQQSLQQLGGPTGKTWVLAAHWTGDAVNGSVPVTPGQIGQAAILQGYFLTSVETVPHSPAPTSGYSLRILDQAGVDVLAGGAASLSATTPQAFSASTSLPPINGTFNITITGNSVASAKGSVYIYMQAPDTLIGSGSAGTAGAAGTPGTDGLTILNGSGVPSGGLGVNGDYYIDNSVTRLYGPKSAGAWGSGVTLVGPTGSAGAAGAAGTNGLSVLNGTGAPSGGTGVNGDFYIDTSSSTLYGPKSAGSWGSGTSLIGPQGPPGSVITLGPLQFLQGKPNVSSPTQQAADLPYFLTSDFDFPAQTPGGTLTASVGASATLTPCPLGVAGADANHYYRIAAGTGTAETVVGTGGSCTSGASSGTLQFTPANNHSGAWTIASDSGGLREVILYSGGHANIQLDANRTILVAASVGVVIDKDDLIINGGGWGSIIKARDAAAVDFVVSSTACNNCTFSNFAIDGNRTGVGMKATGGTALALGTPAVGGANHVVVHRLEIFHSTSAGILVHDSNVDVEVSQNYIHDNGGILNSSGSGQGIYVYWVSASGDALTTGVKIVDNYFAENHNMVTNAHLGGSIAGKMGAAVISGNYSLNGYNNGGQVVVSLGPLGADFDTNGPVQISDNTIIRAGAGGLSEGTSGIEIDSPGVTVTGNTIIGHETGWGIALEGNSTGPGGLGASNTTISGNFIRDAFMSIGLLNAGGYVRGTTISGNRIWTGAGVGVGLDSAAAATTIVGNNFIDTGTPVDDSSTFGAYLYGNYPMAANLAYGGSIASADGINMRCGQVASITGSTPIRFITLPSDTASTNGAGCSVTLIPAAGATWTLGSTGNISVAIGSVAVGRPITLVSNGTLFNPLASASLPAGTPLQYIRYNAQTSAAEAAAFPFLIAADYNFPAQAPGGSIAIGSNTVTLTPCPLGVGGSDVNHYVHLSAGTGTEEGVLLTGGSCTSGATSGTIVFTAAHTHSGAWTVTSGSGGIFEAMNTLSTTGGQVRAPAGTVNIYGTLIVGKATATTQSTINAVSIIGQGSGRAVDIAIPTLGGTTLLWGGASGGTVVKVLGPIGNVAIEDLMIDGNAGLADIGLDIVHSYLSTYRNVNITGWNAIGVRSMAVDFAFPLMVAGNNSNRFDTVEVSGGYGGAANIACVFGQAVPDVSSSFDFASNYISNTACLGGNGIGALIRFADNNTFTMTSFNGAVAALKFIEIAGTGFPTSNVFIQCPMLNLLTASAGFVSITPNFFWPLTTGEYAQDLGLVTAFGAAGVDSYGKYFGRFKNAPMYYAGVTNPAAIANTTVETAFGNTYTIPAGTMNSVGMVGRMHASGRYNTAGTPTLEFQFKLGALSVGKLTFTTGSAVTGDAFSLDCSYGVNTAGAGGALLIGPCSGTSGGFSGTNSTVASSVVGSQGIDTTVAKILTLTAKWGAASASNTCTLDHLSFDALYPSVVQ